MAGCPGSFVSSSGHRHCKHDRIETQWTYLDNKVTVAGDVGESFYGSVGWLDASTVITLWNNKLPLVGDRKPISSPSQKSTLGIEKVYVLDSGFRQDGSEQMTPGKGAGTKGVTSLADPSSPTISGMTTFPRITATLGLPGSGKSTWAREQQVLDPYRELFPIGVEWDAQ